MNEKDEAIGWCDITPKPLPFFKHTGILGMGIIKEYRNNGYGKKLLKLALKKLDLNMLINTKILY